MKNGGKGLQRECSHNEEEEDDEGMEGDQPNDGAEEGHGRFELGSDDEESNTDDGHENESSAHNNMLQDTAGAPRQFLDSSNEKKGAYMPAPTIDDACQAHAEIITILKGPAQATGRGYKDEIPENLYGTWNKSAIDDEDIAQEINLHLQSLGKDITADHIVKFVARPEMLAQLGRKKTILQYADGHERSDVINYQQNEFLPAWQRLDKWTQKWTSVDFMHDGTASIGNPVVIWYHDESTFYANDHHRKRWVHKTEKAVPYAKGEGASMMVADFVSADYGWLRSPEGTESARVLFKGGKGREGYFTNKDIWKQAQEAVKLLKKYYPDEDHVLVYDNATTHLKHADYALSARKMPKGMSKPKTNFGVEHNMIGPNGKPIYNTNGDLLKEKVNMANGKFKDGTEQELYFPEGHENAGLFKGMGIILQEHGFKNTTGKKSL
ncbi:hypothetical protein BDQ12DRAFT_722440 [Crucibulum laeve]|uniref:DDE-1 domain-containing protein n=1 Tax=Crucibulum laeve TaxID=68775 RepID=A0A5C3M337_9AGAR|nr:hypothetical protein BDQ12DRAFT_722440 [Crucibulum laeve]